MMKPDHKWPNLTECIIAVEWFDCGHQVGIAATHPDGRREAMRISLDRDRPFETLFDELEACMS